jgi:Rrf2 family protein
MRELTADAVLAVHALHLMMRKNKAVTSKEIQKSSGFPLRLIRSVVARLHRRGLIRKGSGSGYLLARAPGEITLQDILRSVEEPRTPTAPCGGDFDACATRGACVLAPLCRQADQGFQETLRTFTLAELMNQPTEVPNCLDPKSRAEAS